MFERMTVLSRSEKSAEAVVAGDESVKGQTRRSDSYEGDVLEMASDVRLGGAVRRGRGEAESDPSSDEDRRPRPRSRSTGLTSTSRTARCGPACRVVWERRGR
jgi:hypothetical protein